MSNKDGGQMCLPMCSNRTYTSSATHNGFLLSFICSSITIPSSVIVLAVIPTSTSGLILGGLGLASAASTGLLFFCGTKKNQGPENKEKDKFISSQSNKTFQYV